MQGFGYRNRRYLAEDCDLESLAEAIGTPFYCYSSAALVEAYRRFASALQEFEPLVCYALKANGNQAVIATLAAEGAGADVVSEGELRRALAAGVSPQKVVFAGVGKTAGEMAAALDAGILQFNVESAEELRLLDQVARERGKLAPVALRINPDVEARTHAHISTGRSGHKFGIDMAHAGEVAAQTKNLPGIRLEGLAVHIGSQLTDMAPFGDAFQKIAALYSELRADGFALRRLDLGGGLGIAYRGEAGPDPKAYAEMVRAAVKGLDARLIFEPGRHLVGNAGILVTRVLYVKTAQSKRFVIVDAGMNDLLRPMLYEAWHEILPLREVPASAELEPVDVVGPICETTDSFARERRLPPLAAGDLLAICSTGAYGAVMSSTYNSRPLVPEVMVRGGEPAVVRARPSYEAMIAEDLLPHWLEPGPSRKDVAPGAKTGS